VTPQAAFDQYSQAVYDFLFRMTRRADLAEDLTQETFLNLVRTPERFDPSRGSAKAYLFETAAVDFESEVCGNREPRTQAGADRH
jgi:RNA polymerase sigma factor (sigma-70 family)